MMKTIAAKEAKNRFGRLMDAAQREPVTIEKHGHPVAVMMSVEEYKMIKLGRLRIEVDRGLEQLDTGESTVFDKAGLDDLFDGIQAKGHARRNAGV